MRLLIAAAVAAACACSPASEPAPAGIPEYTYQVVHVYPHDRGAFTEGLFYKDGFPYEATGLEGESDIRKVKLETGEVLQRHSISEDYFGEGIVAANGKLFEMTYKTEVGFIYDFNTFAPLGQYHYKGQGWSYTTDGKQIYMDGARDVNAEQSDPEIHILNPENLQETGVIHVTADGAPVKNLNELEWVKGEIYANIWQTDRIARIDPKTGRVVGWIDMSGILPQSDRTTETDVLNGIAYDAQGDRLFVTGKKWPKLFEIKLVKKTAP
jgi:glutaminyl-peptide cyclotransferase